MKIYSWNEKYKCNKSSNVSKQNLCWLRLLAKVTTEKGQDGDDLPIDSNNQGRRYRWLNSRKRWICLFIWLDAFHEERKWVSHLYSYSRWKWHPYEISAIKMRVFWTVIKYLKSAARLLDRDYVNLGGLDFSKEVLWVSVVQRAAE